MRPMQVLSGCFSNFNSIDFSGQSSRSLAENAQGKVAEFAPGQINLMLVVTMFGQGRRVPHLSSLRRISKFEFHMKENQKAKRTSFRTLADERFSQKSIIDENKRFPRLQDLTEVLGVQPF
jgi:hypothetical protein